MSYYNTFDSDFLYLKPNNKTLICSLYKISNTEFQVTGESTAYADEFQIVWSSQDIIHHGYMKRNTDTNYEGKIVQFSIGDNTNIIAYNDIKYTQKFIIKEVGKDEESIPFIKLGIPVKKRVTMKRVSLIDVGVPYIVEGTVDLTYTVEDLLKTGVEGEDYTVNYDRGFISLIGDKIPRESTVSISFEYHSHNIFKIDFSKLKQNASNIEYFSIPVKIDKSKGEGKDFLYSIQDIKVEMGELSPIPSNLKIHGTKLCEDFRYVKNYNSNLIPRTIDRLGFKREVVVCIGDGDYANLTGADVIYKRFNKGFTDWYTQVCRISKEKGFTNIKVVIPFEQKYMDKKYCQKTKGKRYLSRLNPINPYVIDYYKTVVEELVGITKDMSLRIAIDGFSYSTDRSNNLGVFDDYTINEFKKEFPNDVYLAKGNLSDYDENTVNSDLRTGQWLANKLRASFAELSKVKKCELIVEDRIIFEEHFLEYINSININWTPSVLGVNVKHSNWIEDGYNYIERVNTVKDRFDVDFSRLGYTLDLDKMYLEKDPNRFSHYRKMLKAIDELENTVGLHDITVNTGHFLRGDSVLIYKILPYVELNKLESEIDVALCRANKETMCYLPNTTITNIIRVVDDVDQITLEVPYYVMDRFEHNKVKNYLYDDIKPERLLRVNEKEHFVIKSVEEVVENKVYKNVTALSLEHKLSKRTVVIDDAVMQLYSEPSNVDDDMVGIFNLLENETGWKVGYIDAEVQFEIVDGVQKAKARWFETIDQSWYTFLRDTVSTSFDCLIQFDTLNKFVSVFKNTHVGDDRGLYLTEDNYIKSLATTDSTNEIVTRLTCVGKDEMGIHAVNITGQGYIDNFSYFIENGDISNDLVVALDKYEKATQRLSSQWNQISTSRFNKNKTLGEYKKEHTTVVGEINALKAIKESYEQAGNQAEADRVQVEIDIKVERKLYLENVMYLLQEEIKILDADLNKVNLQLNPANTVDEQGKKIFTKTLLDERQEFIYHDVWVDDTYLDEKILYDAGVQQLDYACKPTVEYSISVVNFLERIGKKKGFNGELFLRDVIMLKTNIHEKEIELYLVGYEYSPKEKTLSLTLSNKFKTSNGVKLLGDILSESKRISRTVKTKKHLWQKVKESM